MAKKLNLIILAAALIVGSVLVAVPFVKSISVGEKALTSRPQFFIRDLGVNEYRIIESTVSTSWGQTVILLYRDMNKVIRAWQLPARNNKIMMPDIHWFRYVAPCDDFGIINNAELIFTCKDDLSSYGEAWLKEWRWDINGNNLGSYTDDMDKYIGHEKNGYFIPGEEL